MVPKEMPAAIRVSTRAATINSTAMKTLSKMMSIAVAAMAFTGCSSEPEIAPKMQPIRLELTAGTTTRTEIGPDNKISWSDTGETLKVLEQVDAEPLKLNALDNDGYTKDPTSGKASFSVALPVKTGTSFRYATLHPKAAYVRLKCVNRPEIALKTSLEHKQTQKYADHNGTVGQPFI